MKRTLFFIFVIASVTGLAQPDVELNQHAFERTAYVRWDEFKPKLLFKVLNRDYDDEDRRTMYIRANQMAQWAIYHDQHEVLQRRTDTLFENETYKALDRTLNKNWLLTQQSKAFKTYSSIEKNLSISSGFMEHRTYATEMEKLYNGIREKIDIVLNSYVDDVEKERTIGNHLQELEKLNTLIHKINGMIEVTGLRPNNDQ